MGQGVFLTDDELGAVIEGLYHVIHGIAANDEWIADLESAREKLSLELTSRGRSDA